MKLKKSARNGIIVLLLAVAGYAAYKYWAHPKFFAPYAIGQAIDSLNGVKVYYNGRIGHVLERNTSADGYNIGLKYQCVEFVKRYYYEHYNHKMPDSYGNAKDFFNSSVADGEVNPQRNLVQYTNPSRTLPQQGDLLIMAGHAGNPYGHVAIVSNVTGTEHIEIIQQNPGPFASSRGTMLLSYEDGKWKINSRRVLGWLRKEQK